MTVPVNGGRVTRKNLVSFYCQFYEPATPTFPPTSPAPTPTIVNPTSATVVLYFKGTSGVWQQSTIQMTLNNTTNVWSAEWDSSNALGTEYEGNPEGKVSWMIFGSGSAQAARQGSFTVIANDANTI